MKTKIHGQGRFKHTLSRMNIQNRNTGVTYSTGNRNNFNGLNYNKNNPRDNKSVYKLMIGIRRTSLQRAVHSLLKAPFGCPKKMTAVSKVCTRMFPKIPVGGRLRFFHKKWEKITTDKWINHKRR